MAIQHLSTPCSECGFPIAGQPGETVICANCGITGKITAISIPDPLFWGSLGILLGLILAKSKVVGEKLARL